MIYGLDMRDLYFILIDVYKRQAEGVKGGTDDGFIADVYYRCLLYTSYSGAVYGLPISDSDIERAQILWLRQDWLDALNLSAPASIDELKEVLRAFKDLSLIHI